MDDLANSKPEALLPSFRKLKSTPDTMVRQRHAFSHNLHFRSEYSFEVSSSEFIEENSELIF